MKIVLFNWRDLEHPRSGGAEVYTDQLLQALARAGHECILFSSSAAGLASNSASGPYTVMRAGNELTCRFHALAWLWRHRRAVDVVIDEVNTLPFLSRFILPRKTILLMHQLAREVWLTEAPPPFSLIGFLLEPLFLQIYRGAPVITISESSRRSFRLFGLATRSAIVECPLEPPRRMDAAGVTPTVGFVGRVTPSKRVDHIIRAFSVAAHRDSAATLEIIGRGDAGYVRKLRSLTSQLGVEARVNFVGHVSREERDERMSRLTCLVMASQREGWGLVVSEAAAYAVPSVAYDVAGLRDSIVDAKTGILVRDGDVSALGEAISMVLRDRPLRDRLGAAAAENLLRYNPGVFAEKAIDALHEFSRAAAVSRSNNSVEHP